MSEHTQSDINTGTAIALASPEQAPAQDTGGHSYYRSKVYTFEGGVNDLCICAQPLLLSISYLKEGQHPNDTTQYMQYLEHELKAFKQRAIQYDYPANDIYHSQYIILLMLAECFSAISTAKHNPILGLFAKLDISYNGHRLFFEWMEQFSQNPQQHIDLLELMYQIMLLDYKGNQDESTQIMTPEIISSLYQVIRGARGHMKQSLHIAPLKTKAGQTAHKPMPWKSISFGLLGGLALLFLSFQYILNISAKPITTQLALVANSLEHNPQSSPNSVA